MMQTEKLKWLINKLCFCLILGLHQHQTVKKVISNMNEPSITILAKTLYRSKCLLLFILVCYLVEMYILQYFIVVPVLIHRWYDKNYQPKTEFYKFAFYTLEIILFWCSDCNPLRFFEILALNNFYSSLTWNTYTTSSSSSSKYVKVCTNECRLKSSPYFIWTS